MIGTKKTILLDDMLGAYAIELTKDKWALVSVEDLEYVKGLSWRAAECGSMSGYYAISQTNGKTVRIHRLLMDCPKDKQVDHINHNTLDNRRENLRIVNQSKNKHNSSCYRNNTSGYKGVYKRKGQDRWFAAIRLDGVLRHLGSFSSRHEASVAYLRAKDAIIAPRATR